jgi:hypothetical protein
MSKIFKQSCLECKHCIKCHQPSSNEYYGFLCYKKNFNFDYNIKAVLKGAVCGFYKEKEVINDEQIK